MLLIELQKHSIKCSHSVELLILERWLSLSSGFLSLSLLKTKGSLPTRRLASLFYLRPSSRTFSVLSLYLQWALRLGEAKERSRSIQVLWKQSRMRESRFSKGDSFSLVTACSTIWLQTPFASHISSFRTALRSYDWFAKFSQEISSQAERSGRNSTITEGDVVAVMKAWVIRDDLELRSKQLRIEFLTQVIFSSYRIISHLQSRSDSFKVLSSINR